MLKVITAGVVLATVVFLVWMAWVTPTPSSAYAGEWQGTIGGKPFALSVDSQGRINPGPGGVNSSVDTDGSVSGGWQGYLFIRGKGITGQLNGKLIELKRRQAR